MEVSGEEGRLAEKRGGGEEFDMQKGACPGVWNREMN